MKKHIEDYGSEMEYMAAQPVYKLVIVAVMLLAVFAVFWIIDTVKMILKDKRYKAL